MNANAIRRYYVLLNVLNDAAYFGFFAIQFFLIQRTLDALLKPLLPAGYEPASHGVTLIVIASQLIWQIPAEALTGVLADLKGRAVAIALSFWCRLLAIILIAISAESGVDGNSMFASKAAIWVFLIFAQMLIATGEASLEGSVQAWLRDECEFAERENDASDSEAQEKYKQVVAKTFEDSAIFQNTAVLISTTTFLAVFIYNEKWGFYLAILSSCLCLIGALIAHRLAGREEFKNHMLKEGGQPKIRNRVKQAFKDICSTLRSAIILIFKKKSEIQVRWLVGVLVLPFPCWIMISWFFTAFVANNDKKISLLTLGLCFALGVPRVLGACIAKWWSSGSDEKKLYLIFNRSIFFNILSLCAIAAALLIVLYLFDGINNSLPLAPALFILLPFGLAKLTEEIVKLSKDKYLTTLPKSDIRATSLSLVAVAQNTFGFTAIFLTTVFTYAFIKTSEGTQTIVIFSVCALLGLIGWVIYRIIYREPEFQASVVEN